MKERHVLPVWRLRLSRVEVGVHIHPFIWNGKYRALTICLWIQSIRHAQIEPGLACVVAIGYGVAQWSPCCHNEAELFDTLVLINTQGSNLALLSGCVPSGS